ncbi:MAG TPA: hypothetical protein VK983_01165 [Candidatus Limnocylindrales bacterium]|nr:hypothetical protein [Candidatus Limnocylindrales bacterium]
MSSSLESIQPTYPSIDIESPHETYFRYPAYMGKACIKFYGQFPPSLQMEPSGTEEMPEVDLEVRTTATAAELSAQDMLYLDALDAGQAAARAESPASYQAAA